MPDLVDVSSQLLLTPAVVAAPELSPLPDAVLLVREHRTAAMGRAVVGVVHHFRCRGCMQNIFV